MIIATQDRQHVGQAIKALKKGYHLLLENQFHRIWVNAEKYPKWQKNVKEKWLSVMF